MSARSGRDRRRRVVITGVGVVSPIGTGTQAFWEAAVAACIGTGDITRFDTSLFHTHRGGEVRGFEPQKYIRVLAPDTLARSTQFAVAATRTALDDAGLDDASRDASRIGVCFGLVLGNRPGVEALIRRRSEPAAPSDGRSAPVCWDDPSVLSRAPAIECGLHGPNLVIPTACAAGNSAIAYAGETIRAGKADAMVAGGADELSSAMFMMFNQHRALAPEFVQPFDKNRKGLMLSEGAGVVVLESEAHARARGASVYCEVRGYGNFTDAYHMTAPHPDGLGAIRSMQAALDTSDLTAGDVDYISAHGTGTPLNDAVESAAIRAVFGAHSDRVAVSSLKSMLGHSQGAASAIEAAGCALAIRDNVVPPTTNYHEPDPACALDIVANHARRQRVDVALNNSFGFGGNICCVVFAKGD